MREFLEIFWQGIKDQVSMVIFLCVAGFLMWFIAYSNQDRIVYREGHKYIQHRGYHSDQLIHSPECEKCENKKN